MANLPKGGCVTQVSITQNVKRSINASFEPKISKIWPEMAELRPSYTWEVAWATLGLVFILGNTLWPLLAFTWCLGCLKSPPDKVFLDLRAFTKFCRCCWEFVNASFFVGAARFWYSGNLPAPTKCRCSKILLVYKIFLHLHFVGAGRFFCRCSNILIEWESCCTYINFCRYLTM